LLFFIHQKGFLVSNSSALSHKPQHFLEPFRKAKPVSEGEINLLFSNIEIILELSQTFLTRVR